MKKLSINYQEPFRAQIKSDILEDDIFFEQYKQSAELLESLLLAQNNKLKLAREKDVGRRNDYGEYTNNIIAFCGDRGCGKTSTMLSFLEHVRKVSNGIHETSHVFSNDSIVKKTAIVDAIYIDPSTLDNEHNILDLLLSNMFQNVKSKIVRNTCYMSLDKQTELLKCFQKVYRTVSIVKDSKVILEKEFDDEGDLSKLSCLSESIRLRDLFEQLLKLYFSFMLGNDEDDRYENATIIIAIDDLDISFANTYEMAEQIRKYLIVPGICILLAINIEQLICCIKEYNMRHFRMHLELQGNGISIVDKVENLARRYVSKLLPNAHRVLLFDIYDIRNFVVDEIDTAKKFDNPIELVNEWLYKKTGMLPENIFGSCSVPKVYSLRDFVSVMYIFRSLPSPVEMDGSIKKDVVLRNIEIYYYNCFAPWVEEMCTIASQEPVYRQLSDLGGYYEKTDFHNKVNKILDKIKQNLDERSRERKDNIPVYQSQSYWDDSLCYCMGALNQILQNRNVNDEEKQIVDTIRFIYVNRLNYFFYKLMENRQNYTLFLNFTNGLIWGMNIDNYIGYTTIVNQRVSRMRFGRQTRTVYNCIAKKLHLPKKFYLNEATQFNIYAVKCSSDEEKRLQALSWLIFGILCNNFYATNGGLMILPRANFFGNTGAINLVVQVSIENYIKYICLIDELPNLLRFDLWKIDDDFSALLIKKIKEYNRRNIELLRLLVCNPDQIYIMHRSISSELNYDDVRYTDYDIIKRFFEEMGKWLCHLEKSFLGQEITDEVNIGLFKYGDTEKEVIDIAELYIELFESMKKDEWDNIGVDYSTPTEGLQDVVDYLDGQNISEPYEVVEFSHEVESNISAEKLKENLSFMAKDIGIYLYLSNNTEYLSEEWKNNLIMLYSNIVRDYIYRRNPDIPKEFINEYNSLAEHFNYNWLRMRIDELKLKRKL